MIPDKGRIFLGKKAFEATSETDRQRVILTGYGASIVIVVCLFFIAVELIIGEFFFILFYAMMISFSLASILLLRGGKLDIAKIVFIVPVLLMVAVLAAIEKQATGVYLYFLAACVYVVTIFGYEKIRYSIVFFLLILALAFISYFYTSDFIVSIALTQAYIDISYMTNFTVSLLSSMLAIYYLMKLNIKSNEHLVKTSKELKESEGKFQLAIRGSSVGIWEWDGVADHIKVSSRLAHSLGYSKEDTVSFPMEKMIQSLHPDDRELFKDSVVGHLRDKKPFRIECRVRTKSGGYMWVLDTGQAEWDESGRVVRMVGSILNIDKRKRAERQIKKQNELLAKANEELDRFVYSTSHDLKAPLTSVQGLINIAELTTDKDELKECLKLMKGRVANLNAFIADITDYSRNSRLGLDITEVELNSLVTEILNDIQHFKGREQININIEIPKAFLMTTDEKRLRIILSNLLNNAIKYHNYDLAEPTILLKAYQEDSVTVIEVSDNGSGIASEHHSNLFDMFYRATEKSDGSGLGLYIVKETVDKLTGTIEVQSEIGNGSEFKLKLPKLHLSN